MSDELMSTEREVLTWLSEHCVGQLGIYWHSLRKIGDEVGQSPSSVLRHVHKLERLGLIKLHRGPAQAYGYEVL